MPRTALALPTPRPLVDGGVEETSHSWPNWDLFSPSDDIASRTSTVSSTTGASSSTLCGQGDSSAHAAGEGRHGRLRHRRSGPQVGAVALIAFIMCFGVCLVGLSGFLPSYLIGFRDVTEAVHASQTQAIDSMVTTASTLVRRLSNVLKLILASQMSECEDEMPCVPRNATQMLFALANILYHPRYATFLAFLAANNLGEQREQSVSVSRAFGDDWLAGYIAQNAKERCTLAAIDPATHLLRSPTRILMVTNITRGDYLRLRLDTAAKYGAAALSNGRAANPWAPEQQSERRVSQPIETWMPFNISGWYAYFSAVVPLWVSPENGSYVGFLEATLRAMYVTNAIQDHLRYAIREHGCYMMVDPMENTVIANSWNQSLKLLPGNNAIFAPFTIEQVTHPLMKAAVEHLARRRHRSSNAAQTSELAAAVAGGVVASFHYGRQVATVRVTSGSSFGGAGPAFVSVVLQADFLVEISHTLRALSVTMLAAALATAVASYYVAVYLRTAILQLTAALKASSKLQFTADPAQPAVLHSRITELVALESAYVHVQQQLMALKTVIPGPLLVAEGDELSDSDGDAAGEHAGERRRGSSGSGGASLGLVRSASTGAAVTEGELPETASASNLTSVNLATGEPGAGWVSRRWQQHVFLNTKVFNEKVNQFHKRYCTMVWIMRPYTLDANEVLLDYFFRVVYAAAGEFRGCLQFLRPDYAVVTFNALTSLPLHAKHACDFALAVQRRMRSENARQISIQIDTNNFLVGTCGSETGRKSRVVFDAVHFTQIPNVLHRFAFNRIVVTQPTAKHLEFYETIPLEVVAIPLQEAPYTLYELRDASVGNLAEMQCTAELFRTGFQYMRIGDYVSARRAYVRVGAADPTAEYLVQLCDERLQAGDTTPYMSRSQAPSMRFLMRALGARSCRGFIRFMTATHKNGLFAPGPISASGFIQDSNQLVRSRADGEKGADSGEGAAGGASSPAGPVDSSRRRTDGTGGDTAVTESVAAELVGHGAEDETDEDLIEWIDFASHSDGGGDEDLMPVDVGGPAADVIPLCLVDGNGQRWNRARRPEHSSPSSIVYQAIADDGLQVAIKFLPKKNRNIPEARLHNEINIMSTLKHLNVVQYISSTWTEAHIGIVMEYAPGGSLRNTIDRFGVLPESLVRRYMVDILHRLAGLHRGGITHGDVKPHNILLGADGVCKLSDFGSTVSEAADLARSNGMLEFCGTAVYTSPEVASGHLPTAASDIFSLGISLLEMLLGRLPWHWRTPKLRAKHGDCVTLREVAFVQAVGLGEIVPMIPSHLPAAAKEFAQACCRTQPGERPTVNDLLSFRFVLWAGTHTPVAAPPARVSSAHCRLSSLNLECMQAAGAVARRPRA